MRSIVFAALTVLAACSDEPGGTLTLKPDAFQIVVNQTTFLTAYLNDGTGAGSNVTPVDVTYSLDPEGIVTLTPYMGIQKVTGEAVGNVVVTATGFGQTAKLGFTVVSP